MKTQEELSKKRAEREQWFIDRIGKTVFRGPNGCDCDSCKKAHVDGIQISDRDHAIYLCDVEAEIGPRYLDYPLPL